MGKFMFLSRFANIIYYDSSENIFTGMYIKISNSNFQKSSAAQAVDAENDSDCLSSASSVSDSEEDEKNTLESPKKAKKNKSLVPTKR